MEQMNLIIKLLNSTHCGKVFKYRREQMNKNAS